MTGQFERAKKLLSEGAKGSRDIIYLKKLEGAMKVLSDNTDSWRHRRSDPEGADSLVLGWHHAKKLGNANGVSMLLLLGATGTMSFPSFSEHLSTGHIGVNARKFTLSKEDRVKTYRNLKELYDVKQGRGASLAV